MKPILAKQVPWNPDYQTIKIEGNFSIALIEPPLDFRLSDIEAAHVESLWKKAQKLQGDLLFNGKLLSFYSLQGSQLFGRFVEYKFYRAQLMDPSLKAHFQIKPISISCVTRWGDKVLVGKRSKLLTTYPGCYELTPSGGIDARMIVGQKVDFMGQALKELEEEASISPDRVKSSTFHGLFYDAHSGIYEIFVSIDLKEGDQPLPSSNAECSELHWVDKKELVAFAKEKINHFLPFSLFLIHHCF